MLNFRGYHLNEKINESDVNVMIKLMTNSDSAFF